MKNDIKCLNPWDPQSKRQYRADGVYAALNAGNAGGGQTHGICYCIQGNAVDRNVACNGKGFCENISATLNTQDRHAVVYAIEGNGIRPSHQGNGYSDGGTMFTLNTIERHAVCYGVDALSSNSMKSKNPNSGFHEISQSKCLDTRCCEPTCNQGGVVLVVYEGQNCLTNSATAYSLQTKADDHHISVVCYDARGNGEGGVVPTITGDHENRITDYTAVLCYNDRRRADYHIAEDKTAPAVVAKYGTGGGNTPLVIVKEGT